MIKVKKQKYFNWFKEYFIILYKKMEDIPVSFSWIYPKNKSDSKFTAYCWINCGHGLFCGSFLLSNPNTEIY